MKSTVRDYKIDLLRLVGILLITLAHVNPTEIVFQLRNFDVVLLVILSGSSFSGIGNLGVLNYFSNRFTRLILSTWFFVTLYFLINKIYYFSLKPINFNTYIESLMLYRGMGYIWVVKVFFICSIIGPYCLKIIDRFHGTRKFYVYLFSFLFSEFLIVFMTKIGINLSFTFLSFPLPYILCFCLGNELKKRQFNLKISFVLPAVLVFIIFIFYYYFKIGGFVFTQLFKYPPRIYFISYSLIGSFFVIWLVNQINLGKLEAFFKISLIRIISNNTIWFYFIHVFFVDLTKNLPIFYANKYLIVIIATSICLIIWVKLVQNFLKIFPESISRFMAKIMLG